MPDKDARQSKIKMPDNQKHIQTFHINLLKNWQEREVLFGKEEYICLGPEAKEMKLEESSLKNVGRD